MMSRAKAIEGRRRAAAEEKAKLLKNIESAQSLKISQPGFYTKRFFELDDVAIFYGDKKACGGVKFTVERGDRIAICGKNGAGKSSVLKLICGGELSYSGRFQKASRLITSYVPQDTSFLRGNLTDYAMVNGIDESLFKAILRKLDFSRTQFEKDMSDFSSGQKKKVLIAGSLCMNAHLLVWDEPLNFIDVLSACSWRVCCCRTIRRSCLWSTTENSAEASQQDGRTVTCPGSGTKADKRLNRAAFGGKIN